MMKRLLWHKLKVTQQPATSSGMKYTAYFNLSSQSATSPLCSRCSLTSVMSFSPFGDAPHWKFKSMRKHLLKFPYPHLQPYLYLYPFLCPFLCFGSKISLTAKFMLFSLWDTDTKSYSINIEDPNGKYTWKASEKCTCNKSKMV